MSKVDDGGPAFPAGLAATTNANGESILYDSGERCAGGMTLRDYFAAKVLEGFILNSRIVRSGSPTQWASDAYSVADAMLKARKGQQ